MAERFHSPSHPPEEEPSAEDETVANTTSKERSEMITQDSETAKHSSPGRKLPVKAVYSEGDMKVTVFDATPDRDIYMRISCNGKARDVRLQRSDPEGALLARFGPELGADMIRVIRRQPVVDRREVSRKFLEAVKSSLPDDIL